MVVVAVVDGLQPTMTAAVVVVVRGFASARNQYVVSSYEREPYRVLFIFDLVGPPRNFGRETGDVVLHVLLIVNSRNDLSQTWLRRLVVRARKRTDEDTAAQQELLVEGGCTH